MNRFSILLTLACVLCAGSTKAQTVFWEDPDPTSGLNNAVNVIVNTVDGNAATGDPTRALVGEVILDGANNGVKFVGINPGPLPIGSEFYNKEYTFSLDYFIPQNTGLDALPDGSSPDLFWIQVDFNGSNVGHNAGFIGAGAAGGGWQTLSLTNTVPPTAGPPPTTSVTPLIVFADGGFGAGSPNGDGITPAVYIDNIRLTIVPEPSSIIVAGLGAVGLVAMRRRLTNRR